MSDEKNHTCLTNAHRYGEPCTGCSCANCFYARHRELREHTE